MAHNLAYNAAGAVRMAYRGESPWHRLGAHLPERAALAEALDLAHLTYGVRLAPLYLSGVTGMIECEIRQAVIRDDDVTAVLGTVGPGYECIQNAEAFGVVDDLVQLGDLRIETAGALGRGETAWLLMSNGTQIEACPGDVVKPHLLIVTSHDGSRSLQAIPTAVRVVCQNTLDMVRDKVHLSVRHTASAGERVKAAKAILAGYGKVVDATAHTYTAMAQREVSGAEVTRLLETVFPMPKPAALSPAIPDGVGADLVAELLGTPGQLALAGVPSGNGEAKGNGGSKGVEERRAAVEYLLSCGAQGAGQTVWGAYNAVTEYVDHVYVSRADGSPKTRGVESALFGAGAAMKARAWDVARKLMVDVPAR